MHEQVLADGDVIAIGAFEITCRMESTVTPAPRSQRAEDSDTEPAITSTLDLNVFDSLLETRVPEPGAPLLAEGFSVARLFFRASVALLATEDLEGTLEAVLDLLFEHLPVRRASLSLVDGETLAIIPAAFRALDEGSEAGMRISNTVALKAIKSRQAVLLRSEAGIVDGERLDSCFRWRRSKR